MKKETDLGLQLRLFLTDYLPKQRNATPGTIRSYRDALKLLLQFVSNAKARSVAEIEIAAIDRSAVLAFLNSIESSRGNGVTTRNQRLAAIRSFFRFVSATMPEKVEQCGQILAIPAKRGESRTIDYLTAEEIAAIMNVIPMDSQEGRRDDAIIRFLYNTGARIQEAMDVRPCDLQLERPAHVLLRGKGRKERLCPLWPDTAERLRSLIVSQKLSNKDLVPLFSNRQGHPLTRFGATYILAKYVQKASSNCTSIARKNIHPHTLRHTTAMHLLQSGVDLNTIRCWLGHSSITTTNRYVEIDLEMKRRALDAMNSLDSINSTPAVEASILDWLESL